MAKTRKIELSYNNRKEVMVLPINPPDMELVCGQLNKKQELLSGEANIHGEKAVVTTSIASFFPSVKSPFYMYADKKPIAYIRQLERWKESDGVIRLIIPDADVNMAVLIDNLTYKVMEGSEDIAYTLDISENPSLNVSGKKSNHKTKKNGLKGRPGNRAKPKKYTVKKGDTIRGIAKRYYGSVSGWKKIYQANKSKMSAPKYILKKGTVLTLP